MASLAREYIKIYMYRYMDIDTDTDIGIYIYIYYIYIERGRERERDYTNLVARAGVSRPAGWRSAFGVSGSGYIYYIYIYVLIDGYIYRYVYCTTSSRVLASRGWRGPSRPLASLARMRFSAASSRPGVVWRQWRGRLFVARCERHF